MGRYFVTSGPLVKKKISCLFLLLTITSSFHLAAEINQESFLAPNYITAGLLHQKLAGKREDKLAHSQSGLFLIEYASTVHDDWWLGFGLNFQPVTLVQDNAATYFITLHEKVSRLIRLYDRFYGAVGGKLIFAGLYQNKGIKIINPANLSPEIGGAMTAEIFYSFSKDMAFGISFDRFRGFKSSDIEGYHLALCFHLGLL